MPQQKNPLTLIAGLALVVLVGGALYFGQMKGSPAPATDTTGDVSNGTTTSTSMTHTMADVAKHASASSCWSVVDNQVYDLTQWIGEHPGGPEAIMGLCGHDGSTAFHDQHGNAKRQEDILATFKIGALAP